MSEDTEVTTTPQPAALRGNKRTSARNHCVGALAELNRFAEPHFDLGLLPRTDLPDPEWNATMQRVLLAVAAALKGAFIESGPEVSMMHEQTESPEIQVSNYEKWQQNHSGYYHWNALQLRELREYLLAHPGSKLIPNYAYSCSIRHPDGRIVEYRRDGVVS